MPLRYRFGTSSCSLAGLIIVLALLGHDLLMASRETATAPVASMHHARTSAQAVTGIAVTPPVAPDDYPRSPHPSACGTGGTALFPSVDQPDAPDLGSAAVTTCAGRASSHGGLSPWHEPRWPPGTRRALLQVYRI